MTGGSDCRERRRRARSHRRIALWLYPFGAGAMAVNVFMLSLLGHRIGLPVLSATWSVVLGCIIGIPATYTFARHIRRLMDTADADAEFDADEEVEQR